MGGLEQEEPLFKEPVFAHPLVSTGASYEVTGTWRTLNKKLLGGDILTLVVSTQFLSLCRLNFYPPIFEFKLNESLKGGPSSVSQ